MSTTIGMIHAGGFWGHGWGVGFWGPWMFFPTLFWIAFLGLIVWAVTRKFSTWQPGGSRRRGDQAEEILRERFARGEMDAEEYQRAVETLHGNSSQSRYEDYVREAEDRLKREREEDS